MTGIVSLRVLPCGVVGAEQWLIPKGRGNGSGRAARDSSDVWEKRWDWVRW